ncbi:hypothetical protein ACTJK3_24410 [Pseudomonas sp. 22105]|uniref:hypothetical protein n=1 Tax=unclassified Pseudomonas TaxID=196821 RepID=UPI003F838AD8
MQTTRTRVVAWSREDLICAAMTMMKIAGWSLALVWAVYLARFTSVLGPIHTFIFGTETPEQILNAKAAWGQFGDFVGGTLNPMVSLLALVGLVFTILLQQEAMMLSKKDSVISKKALFNQTRLSLETARLQSLVAALEVVSEMHRQALEIKSVSSIELLRRKEAIASQILEINESLTREVQAEKYTE